MDAGLMRHKIIIQKLSQTQNEFGEIEQAWETVTTVRASINAFSERDFLAGLSEQAEATHKVTIRYNKLVDRTMRAVFGTRVFPILHIRDPWEKHQEMVLTCKELV